MVYHANTNEIMPGLKVYQDDQNRSKHTQESQWKLEIGGTPAE
jgi:hypothetical protein